MEARNTDVIPSLLERGADPAQPAVDGSTPLAAARQAGDAEIVRWLEGGGK